MKVLRWLFVAALVIGVGVLGYAAGGPYLVLREMRAAAAARDSDRLSDVVDFSALRQNLKQQLDAKLAERVHSDNPLAALALGVASNVVGRAIDSMVTPDGLALMMAGQRFALGLNGQPAAPGPSLKLLEPTHTSYDSSSEFSAFVAMDGGAELRFVLTRDGLRWRLSNIVLPASLLASLTP